MGFFALSTLLVAGAGVYLLTRAMPNFKIGNKKIQQDLKAMKEELSSITQDLIPMAAKDIELLSERPIDTNNKRRFTQDAKGRLETIFHEPVAAYFYRKYRSKKEDALLYVQMNPNSFYYWVTEEGIRLTINNNYIGIIDQEMRLYGGTNKRLIGRLNRHDRDYHAVIIGDKEVGGLSNRRDTSSKDLTGRAFEYVAGDLSDGEKALLLAFAYWEIINNEMAK